MLAKFQSDSTHINVLLLIGVCPEWTGIIVSGRPNLMINPPLVVEGIGISPFSINIICSQSNDQILS